MPAFKDITGQRFARLTVIFLHSKASHRLKRPTHWVCRCDCGNEVIVSAPHLRTGHTRSCGCLKAEGKHGQSLRSRKSGAYNSWHSMIQRCTNPNATGYCWYGERGIKVCDQWLDFANFFADMGPRPDGWTIERIDRHGNYEPSNCKWIPNEEQPKNQGHTSPADRKARQLGLRLPRNKLRGRLIAERRALAERDKSKKQRRRPKPARSSAQLEFDL